MANPALNPVASVAAKREHGLSKLAWLLLALSVAVCVVWFVHSLGYWEDDAWIHLEFARSVAAGKGFSFNGRVVYGDTSPLWVWLLCAAHLLIPAWMAAGKALTVVGAAFALTGVFWFSRSLVRGTLDAAQSDVFAAAMVLVLVTNPYFGYWAFSGMEALTAAGLVCWGGLTVARAPICTQRFLCGALVVGVAPLLRPEMSFFSVLLGLVLVYRWWTMPGRNVGVLAGGLVLAIVPAAVWFRYAVRTFGSVLPNTNAAKRAGPGDNVAARLVSVYAFGFPVVLLGLTLLAVWLGWYWLRGRKDGASSVVGPVLGLLSPGGWLLFVWTAINCTFYVLDHTYVQTRYIFVTAPVLTVALLALAVQGWPRVYKGLLAGAVAYGLALSSVATWPLVRNKIGVDQVYAELAAEVRTLPPEAAVANYSIGEAAFLSERTIVDTGGITRPGAIPFLADADNTRMLAWIRSQGADYWVVDEQPTPGAVLLWSHDVPTTGWYTSPKRYRATEHLHLWKLPAR